MSPTALFGNAAPEGAQEAWQVQEEGPCTILDGMFIERLNLFLLN